jgi:hypothetical protein
MPFDPAMLTTEADETPLRALQAAEQPQTQADDQEPATKEPEAPPEPPAATSETVEEFTPEAFGSPAEMWEALQNVDTDGLQYELGEQGWSPEDAEAAQDYFDQLQDLADEDPLAAADLLGQVYAAQVHALVQAEAAAQLQPMLDREYQAQAADIVTQLQSEFGVEVMEANKERLAEMMQRSPAQFLFGGVDERGLPVALDAAGRHEAVRRALIAAESDRQAAWERGDDLKEAARTARVVERDAFGLASPGQNVPWPEQAPAPAGPQQAPAVPPPAPAPAARDSRAVFVEGGSTPGPGAISSRPLSWDEQIKANITAAGRGNKRDLFGRIPSPGPAGREEG